MARQHAVFLSQKPAEDHGCQPVGECQKLKRITSFRVPRASASGYLLQWCKGAVILCTIGLLQFCPQGGHLCSVPCLKDLWKKAQSPSWSALHSSAYWAPIASICGMSAPRRSNRPETSCSPASMI